MKLIVSRIWFLSLCSAVAVGSQIWTTETKTSLNQCVLKENGTEQISEELRELRIVLVGKTGVGKSATANTILGEEVFKSRLSSASVTRDSKKEFRIINGRKVSIIDTPGVFDTSLSNEELEKEIKMCISYSAPGPHAFLIVLNLERYTEENAKTIEYIERLFGEEALYYTMVVFTHGDQLKGQDIKTFVRSSPGLRKFVHRCGRRYFVIDNTKPDSKQVMQLLHKIDEMVLDNGGEYYTNDMLQEAERAIEEEKQRILKENEEQRMREIEALELKFQEKQQEEMRKELAKIQEKQQEEMRKELAKIQEEQQEKMRKELAKYQVEEQEKMRKELAKYQVEEQEKMRKEFAKNQVEEQEKMRKEFAKNQEEEQEKMRKEFAKNQEENARMKAEENNGFLHNVATGVKKFVNWIVSCFTP